MLRSKFAFPFAAFLLVFVAWQPAHAFVVRITPPPRSLFLQVGTGTMTGGSFNSGGTPGDNATINSVSVTVPAASVGAGVLNMATDSTVTDSSYNNRAFCSVPAEVYVGGFYRAPGPPTNATLSVTSPAVLSNGAGDTLAFNTISWVSGGIGDSPATLASGTFSGSPQTLYIAARSTWFESCLAFNYANAALAPSGTFTGRVTYTLTAP